MMLIFSIRFTEKDDDGSMRRFSTICKLLQKSKYAELNFLQQVPSPPSQNLQKNGNAIPGDISNQQNARSSAEAELTNTKALKLLMNAVKHRQFETAERLFHRAPKLAQRPAALRLLIKLYCDQLDFTTAKALLFASLSKVGEKGASRFIAHVAYDSQNAADIEDVVSRVFKEFGAISPEFTAGALCGLRFLDDTESFDRVWNLAARQWEPSLKSPTLLAKAFSALLNEEWDLAIRLWKISHGLSRGSLSIPPLQIWYMACRYYLVEKPKVECVEKILQTMQELDLSVSPALTALLLRHLAPLFPAMSASQWIDYAKQRGWPLDRTVAEIVISHSQGGLSNRLSEEHTPSLRKYASKRLSEAGLTQGGHRLGEGPRFRPDLDRILRAKTGQEIRNTLHSMVKRGLRPPYSYFVSAFQRITSFDSDDDLHQLVALFRSSGYPIHCAGTDLSVVELHCRRSRFDNQTSQRLLGEYLVQYPLISHDLPQLTRIAVLLSNCGAHSEAAIVVDSVRSEQQHNAAFSCANHDSASLQVLASAKYRMREPVVPLLRGVIADSPNIYFDPKFMRKVKRILMLNNEELDVLQDLKSANEETIKRAYEEIDKVVGMVTSGIAT